jgi:hypothetical protein
VNTAIRTYGVISDAPTEGGGPALAFEELSRIGYTVLQDIVSTTLVVEMKRALDRILAEQTARFGAARMQAISDATSLERCSRKTRSSCWSLANFWLVATIGRQPLESVTQ